MFAQLIIFRLHILHMERKITQWLVGFFFFDFFSDSFCQFTFCSLLMTICDMSSAFPDFEVFHLRAY